MEKPRANELLSIERRVALVDSLEHEFLRGHFREALGGANRQLLAGGGDPHHTRPPQRKAPRQFYIGSFRLWSSDYELRVHAETLEKDRIGAVALQAWYELWKQQNQREEQEQKGHVETSRLFKDKEDHSRLHLRPFLKGLCLRECSMSVELSWMFIQLLSTLGEHVASVQLAVPLWGYILGNDKQHHYQFQEKLTFMITKILSHLTLSANDKFWETWYTKDGCDLSFECNHVLPYPAVVAIDSLQKSIPSVCSHFQLPADLAEELHSRLEKVRGTAQPKNTNSVFDSTLSNPSHPRTRIYLRIKRFLVKAIQQWILQGDENENGFTPRLGPQHRAMVVTVFVVSSWLTWRNSTTVSKLIRRVFRLLAAPIREIVEAFLPRQIQSHHP